MLDLSPFRLDMFRQCRRKYKYHYVDRLSKIYGKPRPYFTMGGHVHWALSTFLRGVTPPEKRTFRHLEGLLRNRWMGDRSGFVNLNEEREYWQKALRQIRGFCEMQDVSAVPWMTEAIHKAPLTSRLRLMGKIDRVDRLDGGLSIVDYKTGKRPLMPNLLQLRAYALILQKKFDQPVVSARYLYLESGGITEICPQEEDLAEAEAEMIAGGEEILSEQSYSPAPNRLCPYCDYHDICPEGIAYGGPAGNPEEELEEQ